MANDHVELKNSRRRPPPDSKRLRDVDPNERIKVTVTLKGPELPAPANMPKRPLSRSEIDRRFGVRLATIRKVERVLQAFRLRVDDVKQGGRSLRVSGTAAAMIAAFQPKLGVYRLHGLGEIRGRHGRLMIPRALQGIVTGVEGLDQRPMAFRHAAHRSRSDARTTARAKRGAAAALSPGGGSGPDGCLTPTDVLDLYNFPPGNGAGQTIVIAEFGAPLNNGKLMPPAYLAKDVQTFCKRHRLRRPKVKVRPVDITPLNEQQYRAAMRSLRGGLRRIVADGTAETAMDVELVAGLCPKADIGVYFASWTQKGWIDLLDEVTSLETTKPITVSISYGLAEESPDWSHGAMDSVNHRLQIAAMMGINICVAAGDDGIGCSQRGGGRYHVLFPASSPFTLGVGGTMMTKKKDGEIDEVVWWEAPGHRTDNGKGGATGGGVSARNNRPPWQKVRVTSLNPRARNGCVVPDVAALAGPPSFDIVLGGKPANGGGTSASTPVWAALIARIAARLPATKRRRFLVPLLYHPAVAKTGFRDIVSGANGPSPRPGSGYEARRGFDAVSGLGVPDGRQLLAALKRA
jgi:kumamolisin